MSGRAMTRATRKPVSFTGGDAVLGMLPGVAVSGSLGLSKLLALMSSGTRSQPSFVRDLGGGRHLFLDGSDSRKTNRWMRFGDVRSRRIGMWQRGRARSMNAR